ncbi:TonB-dependent receptor [Alkalicaulis satelles]|uniref:TonB-dependent receptor n=1 Tax=Alkalicaulis satelles TaxID=2609175 RepID=A0A5M6ZL70_9PROT|nr:TonB-dependent receptor [Alkalicaulis satelles]KAA5804494.1 TonB-dependent receptor [Alkalicaulis satelles]
MRFRSALRICACLAALSGLSLPADAAQAAQEEETIARDVITITAGRAPGAGLLDRPVSRLTRADLDAGGQSDLGRALALNPAFAGSEFNDDPGTQNNTSGTAAVNLRGLGLGASLVLLNGQRQTITSVAADDGSTFVDMNALVPSIAIERVEILKDGASPLHGSDALAGVINVITRDRFEGLELRVEGRLPDNFGGAGNSMELAVMGGRSFGNWRHMGAISVRRTDGVEGFETGFIPGTGLSALGQPGAYYIQAPGGGFALVNPDGSPIPVLDQDCAAAGGLPLVTGAATAFGDPGFCQLDFGQFFSLIPDETRINAFSALSADLGEAQLTVRAGLAHTDLSRGNSPSLPALSFPTIPAANPGNYFGQDVTWLGRPQGVSAGAARRSFEHLTWRLDGELTAPFSAFARQWEGRIAAGWSANRLDATITDAVADRLDLALNGLGGPACPAGALPGAQGCLWFNPFGSGGLVTDPSDPRYNDPALLGWLIQEDQRRSDASLGSLDASATAPALFEAPGGPASLALGAQIRRERLSVEHGDLFNDDAFLFIVGGPNFSGSRTVSALFAETLIPVSGRTRVQAALRYETLEAFSSLDPKLSIAHDLTHAVTVSAGWSRSFRAPSLHQQISATTSLQSLNTGASSTFLPVRTVGAADLGPERADTFTAGAALAAAGWSTRLDLWRIEVDNLVVRESAQAILIAASDGAGGFNDPRVEVSPAGDVTLVRAAYVNAPSVTTQGLDLTLARAPVETAWGAFGFGAEGVYVERYDFTDPVLNQTISAAGNRNFTNAARSLPRLRATAFADWASGPWSARVQARHIAAYDNDEAPGGRIGAWTVGDVQAGWRGETAGRGFEVTLGALNVTNEAAPFVPTPLGYDTKVHDARGRVFYLRLAVTG